MEWVAQMTKLQSLALEYTGVGDPGFAKLASLTGLTELRLDHVNLTDASLKVLTSLRNLHYIDLYHTALTEQGYEGLQKALPDCKINWNKDSTRRERRT
jgi:hypothetical protein